MRQFMIALLNTSAVTGVCIVLFLFIFSFWGKRYGAKCRRIIWSLIAVCCLVPFRFPAVLPYSVDIPDVVIRRGETDLTANAANTINTADTADAATQSGQEDTGPAASAQEPGTGNPAAFGVLGKEITVTDVFFILWIGAGAALLLYYFLGYRRLKGTIERLGYECTDAGIRKILREEAERCQLRRIPRLWILRDSSMGPFAIGVLQNTIVLPEDVSDERKLRFILRHELLHCKKKDILWKLFFLVVNIIHWFNPFVWLLRKAAEQDIEICCDEAVVSGEDRTYREEYSEVIMSQVAKGSCKWNAASTGYAQEVKFIRRRFDSIMGGRRKRGTFLIVVACAVLLLAGSLIHLQNGKKIYAPENVPIDNDTVPHVQIFEPEEVAVVPELVEYNFEDAAQTGEAEKLAGDLPGAAMGTWYTVTIDGVEYYYANYDDRPEEYELLGWAIVDDTYELSNGLKTGMKEEEVLARYPDMAVIDFENNYIYQDVTAFMGWNGTAYPRSYAGRDRDWDYGGKEDYSWTDQFDYIMAADIALHDPEQIPKYLGLLVKDHIVVAITFYYPTAG